MLLLNPRCEAVSADEQRAALSAPVADPAWMLARQWQTGGFVADDAGTPVRVQVSCAVAPLGAPTPASALGGAGPLRPAVEAGRPPSVDRLDTAARVRLAAELMRGLRDQELTDAGVDDVRVRLASAYPLHTVTAGDATRAFTGRLPDATALAEALALALDDTGAGDPRPALAALAGADAATRSAAVAACRAWYAWVSTQLSHAGTEPLQPGPSWDPIRLEHHATIPVTMDLAQVDLRLDGYDGNGLDWYAFDQGRATAGGAGTPTTVEVLPTPIRFAGMPEPRVWAMERGDVNLDAMLRGDPAHALLATFAHSYTNDWFLVPLDLPAGSAVRVTEVTVVDTFGSVTAIEPSSALDGPQGRWRMYDLAPARGAAADAALAGLRVLPSATAPPIEGPVLEETLVARDEMANIAWLVEVTTRDDDGAAVDRPRRWLQLRTPERAPTADGEGTYRLGTTVPDHWYPLQASGTTPVGLTVAALPPGAFGLGDDGVRGHLVDHGPGGRIADEEASRAGTRVLALDRLAYTGAGHVVWTARSKRPGAGEASSGLRFDLLGAPAGGANLVVNPRFEQARRVSPPPLTGASRPGIAAGESWGLWNNPDAVTTTWVEPTTRAGGVGWMLHVTTTASGCGLVQQWAPTDTGPATAEASVWLHVIRGVVIVGSGNGGSIQPDATSTARGRWERLVAANGRTPVNEIVVYAASDGGAEFLVDEVTVVAAPAAPA